MTDDTLMKIYVYRNPQPVDGATPIDLIVGRLYAAYTGSDAAPPPPPPPPPPVAYGWTPGQAMRRAQQTVRRGLVGPTPILVELVAPLDGTPPPTTVKSPFQGLRWPRP